MQVTFRPLPDWPHPKGARRWPRFKASWTDTMRQLEHEIIQLHGRNVIFGVGLRESDIRLDGQPRANARAFGHPGVEISFDSKFGRLTYATDEYDDWQANVRAIALSLEALRAVDRHGVSKRGEQYAGWAQLAAGEPLHERGRALVVKHGGSLTAALKATHPDMGGDTEDFKAVIAYKEWADA